MYKNVLESLAAYGVLLLHKHGATKYF